MMAKSLIRNRHAVTKLHGLKSQLQAISLRIQVRTAAAPGSCGSQRRWGRLSGTRSRALRLAPPPTSTDADEHAGDG